MDEKTEELRDIFMSVADEETVTDEQQETPGTLAGGADDDQLVGVVEAMREDREFASTLADEELAALVRGFYAGRSDTELADDLDTTRDTVFRARMDLHLLRDDDLEGPFDATAFREAAAEGTSVSALADRFEVSETAARRYRRAVAARQEILRVNDRYRDRFETVLQDPELADRFTTQESGLDEATADQEVNLSF